MVAPPAPALYGTLPYAVERRFSGPRPSRKLLAVTLVLCATFLCVAVWRENAVLSPSALITGAVLGKTASDIARIDDEVSHDMADNEVLLNHYQRTFSKRLGNSGSGQGATDRGAKHCNCDCSGSPQFAAKTGQMLAQVGDNVFFGPCSSCPCMVSNTIEGQVAQLSKEMASLKDFEGAVESKEKENIPVDIVIRQGPKGAPGAPGPQGFKGPDGEAGPRGYKGETGEQGDKGPRGEKGPKGFKGDDGREGNVGDQGDRGDPGPPGQAGSEGPEGVRGRKGRTGNAGSDGDEGSTGATGDPGPVGEPGLPGPPGPPGPRGNKGDKGGDGDRGEKGIVGNAGLDGSRGSQGSAGLRGFLGKSCDGTTPADGQPAKTIDACGVCGGDESECAYVRDARTAHATGDPHYQTFDGMTFDYQYTGQFILARHMSDIEFQNEQMPCPNDWVRCNIKAAVVTKNWNLQFWSQHGRDRILVNGVWWHAGRDYNLDQIQQLDVNVKLLMKSDDQFTVFFNDFPTKDGCEVYGSFTTWEGGYLPSNRVMHLFFKAPGRWSSGLSMTGLFGNFDGSESDDSSAINPTSMWHVKGTPRSAFDDNNYRLVWSNRLEPDWKIKGKLFKANKAEMLRITDWEHKSKLANPVAYSFADEQRDVAKIEPLTESIRQRLFQKMKAEGVIERTKGEKRPTSLLAKAELDISPYVGERPSRLRVEQQILFRDEWKVLTPKQRLALLAGDVSAGSTEAVGMDQMCHECIKGSSDCEPNGVGIQYENEKKKKICRQTCLPWIPFDSPSACKCRIDCSMGFALELSRKVGRRAYLSVRTLDVTPSDGTLVDTCLNLNQAAVRDFAAQRHNPAGWTQKKAENFMVSFFWKPDMSEEGTYRKADQDKLKNLIWRGQKDPANPAKVIEQPRTMLSIDADTSSGNTVIQTTIAGQTFRAGRPFDSPDATVFVAVVKENMVVRIYLAESDDEYAQIVLERELQPSADGGDPYLAMLPATEELAKGSLFITKLGVTDAELPMGKIMKVSWCQGGHWDDAPKGVDVLTNLTRPMLMWTPYVRSLYDMGPIDGC